MQLGQRIGRFAHPQAASELAALVLQSGRGQ
jgi:hypothetical protein